MNIYVEVNVETHVFLTLIVGGELSASCALGKSSPYPLDRKLVGLHSWSGQCGEVGILGLWDSNSDPSLIQPVTSYYTYYAISTHPSVPSKYSSS
jgi:hypothetical protein